MSSIGKIKMTELKNAVKALNESGLLARKLTFVGVTKEKLVTTFSRACDKLIEKNVKMPKEAADFYNTIYKEEIEGSADGKRNPEKKSKSKQPRQRTDGVVIEAVKQFKKKPTATTQEVSDEVKLKFPDSNPYRTVAHVACVMKAYFRLEGIIKD